jgi:NAD(P)-dependent dehydrogenase (short-subunit alcohol dehydrogenase family)/2-polyprenyl-6-methoxyphenol hydroxylase-like FAD-dependent oxidoreductase
MDTEVIVVGAGPVGLLLAGELRLGGVDVVVLEQLAEPTGESRASQLNARSIEILDQRGLLDRLGSTESVAAGHFGGIAIDVSGVSSPHPGFWKIPQFRSEAMLWDWVLELGADLRRGHRLVELVEGGDHVRVDVIGPDGATVGLRARYVVGCDGEQSSVRRLTGIEFPGSDASRELLRADVAGIDVPNRRFERHESGLAIAARRPDGVTRIMVHEFGHPATSRTRPPTFDQVTAAWARVTGEDIAHGTPVWVDAFGDASRQAATYRRGRVLLAGDAAHLQMPAGGQALNLGLQDAANLGWKLAATVHGWAPADLLDSYHDERHPIGARVLSNVAAQAMLLLGGPETESIRTILTEILALGAAGAHLAAMVSGLDVRYEHEPSDHALVGARLPRTDLPTEHGPTSTTTLMRPARGVLLDLAGDGRAAEGLRATAARWVDRVDHVRTSTRPGGVLDGLDALLVRPDGHVAWVGPAGGGPGPEAALRRWFGAPTATSDPSPHDELRRPTVNKLQNKTALVTGSSRGIGRATAERLGREGALVAVHYSSNTEAAELTVKSITAAGGRAFALRAELGVPGDIDTLCAGLEAGLLEHTGRTDLDILVNNAGIMGGVSPEDMTPDQFDRLMAINAKAPLFLVQRLLPVMPDGGRIINISSGLTRVANPREIAYAMTKGAVEMISLHYARYLGPRNITVNSVAPGITNNGNPVFEIPEARQQMAALSAFNRLGEPEDIADVVAFLASDDARAITGAFIDASGGTLLG